MPLTVVIPTVVEAGMVGIMVLVDDHIGIAESVVGAVVHALVKTVLAAGTGILVDHHVAMTTLLVEIDVHDLKHSI